MANALCNHGTCKVSLLQTAVRHKKKKKNIDSPKGLINDQDLEGRFKTKARLEGRRRSRWCPGGVL